MNKRLIHPDYIDSLFRFFNQFCDIEEYTETGKDEYNAPIYDWTPIHSAVECIIGPDRNPEKRTDDYNYSETQYRIILKGSYTELNEKHRIKTGNEVFKIDSVERDSLGIKTSLVCRRTDV